MIDIRVMWFSAEEEREAKKIIEKIVKTLEEMGYRVSKPKRFPNRRNAGARIYFKVDVRGARKHGYEGDYYDTNFLR